MRAGLRPLPQSAALDAGRDMPVSKKPKEKEAARKKAPQAAESSEHEYSYVEESEEEEVRTRDEPVRRGSAAKATAPHKERVRSPAPRRATEKGRLLIPFGLDVAVAVLRLIVVVDKLVTACFETRPI